MGLAADAEAFRSLVHEYESLMESVPSIPRQEFEPAALSVLSRLYAAALPLWFAHEASVGDPTDDDHGVTDSGSDDAESAGDDAERDMRTWLTEYERRHDALSSYLGDHGRSTSAKAPKHDDEPQGWRLAEDLISVLDDLKAAERFVDEHGDPRDWAFGFFHWGDHAVSALGALFEFVVIEPLSDFSVGSQ